MADQLRASEGLLTVRNAAKAAEVHLSKAPWLGSMCNTSQKVTVAAKVDATEDGEWED